MSTAALFLVLLIPLLSVILVVGSLALRANNRRRAAQQERETIRARMERNAQVRAYSPVTRSEPEPRRSVSASPDASPATAWTGHDSTSAPSPSASSFASGGGGSFAGGGASGGWDSCSSSSSDSSSSSSDSGCSSSD